jgi:acetyl esterase/lipase
MCLASALAGEPAPDRILPYKEVEGRTLSLHLFQPDIPPEETRPVVVFFHGGGWNKGTPAQFYPQAAVLRDRGLLCVSVEYRLSTRDNTSPFDAIRDAFDALRFVRAHAPEWGGDPARIAAAGGSAGGHLAAATATLTAEDLAGDADAARKARPNLLILFNPVYDNSPEGYGQKRLGDRWREASPAHNLHADMPPTLVMLGERDHFIPVATARRVADELDRLHVPNRLRVYKGGGHGFFNYGRHDNRFYHPTLEDTLRFLSENNWLPTP